MKPPLRTKSVGTKVSEAEYAELEERARGAGMRLAEWVREALLSAPVASGPDSGEVALGLSRDTIPISVLVWVSEFGELGYLPSDQSFHYLLGFHRQTSAFSAAGL